MTEFDALIRRFDDLVTACERAAGALDVISDRLDELVNVLTGIRDGLRSRDG